MRKKSTPTPRRTRGIRRSKASQARLDAILGAIGDDPDAMRKLVSAVAEIAPDAIVINT